MRFSSFKEFRNLAKPIEESAGDVLKYLEVDLTKTLRELGGGLTKLGFDDNFDCFIKQVTIGATSQLAIRNELRNDQIPRYRIILRGGSGAQDVVDGTATWTKEYVYLQNLGGSSVTVTVAFLR